MHEEHRMWLTGPYCGDIEKIMLYQTSPKRTAENCEWTKDKFTPQNAACHWNARGSGNQSWFAHMAQGAFTGRSLDTLTWRLPGVNKSFYLIHALVIWTLFPLQFGKRLEEYLFVLKSAGMWGRSREQGHSQRETRSARLSRCNSVSAGSWAMPPFHFVLCSEFYKASCVPVSASGLVKSLPIMLGWVTYRRIYAVLPALGDFVSLAIFAFCSLDFCSQINAMEFLFPLANKRKGEKKCSRCPVYLAGKEGQDLWHKNPLAVRTGLRRVTPTKAAAPSLHCGYCCK